MTPGTQKSGRKNPEPVLSGFRTGFPVRTFCSIVAHPGQLQEWQGYPRIGLDVRIPKIPILPVFRIWFGHKSGKTVFPFCSFVAYTGQLQKRQGYPRIGLDLRIPTVPIFPVLPDPVWL